MQAAGGTRFGVTFQAFFEVFRVAALCRRGLTPEEEANQGRLPYLHPSPDPDSFPPTDPNPHISAGPNRNPNRSPDWTGWANEARERP